MLLDNQSWHCQAWWSLFVLLSRCVEVWLLLSLPDTEKHSFAQVFTACLKFPWYLHAGHFLFPFSSLALSICISRVSWNHGKKKLFKLDRGEVDVIISLFVCVSLENLAFFCSSITKNLMCTYRELLVFQIIYLFNL